MIPHRFSSISILIYTIFFLVEIHYKFKSNSDFGTHLKFKKCLSYVETHITTTFFLLFNTLFTIIPIKY